MKHDEFMKILKTQVKTMTKEYRALEKKRDRAKDYRTGRAAEVEMNRLDRQIDQMLKVVGPLDPASWDNVPL